MFFQKQSINQIILIGTLRRNMEPGIQVFLTKTSTPFCHINTTFPVPCNGVRRYHTVWIHVLGIIILKTLPNFREKIVWAAESLGCVMTQYPIHFPFLFT